MKLASKETSLAAGDKAIKDNRRRIRKLQAELGAIAMNNDENDIQLKAERIQDVQALQTDTNALRAERRNIERKVKIKYAGLTTLRAR